MRIPFAAPQRKPAIDLSKVKVASPCPADWNAMIGNDRVRHCAECDLNVYDFSAMPEREVQELVATTSGRLCGRFYRRADGTMITQDCPRGISLLGKPVSKAAVVLMSTLMATTLAGCGARPLQGTVVAVHNPGEQSDTNLMLILVDQQGAVIAHADVTVKLSKGERSYKGRTNNLGELHLERVVPGDYVIEVKSPGFKSPNRRVALKAGQTLKMKLEVKIDGEVVMLGVVAVDPMIDTDSSQLGRTYSSKEITSLPRR